MRAAIVIPSIAVDPLLERCVKECRRTCPDADVVVLVDDAGGRDRIDGVATVIECGAMTIGAKRNLGARQTDAEVIAFIDSDAYPADGWLDNAIAALRADPTIDAVGGPNVSPPVETRSERWVGLAHNSFLVAGWWRYRRDAAATRREVGALPSCNLVVRRTAFDDVDGMNPTLFTAEDTDFCRRFTAAGHRILFTPDVLVFHKNRDLKGFVVQRYTFGVAMVPLLRDGRAPDPGYTAASIALAAFVSYLGAGPLLARRRSTRRWWAATLGAYASLVAVEAWRRSPDRDDVGGVAIALLIGNLAPGIGVLTRAAGLAPDLRGIYRNDR